jgi:hypothetical protein
VFAQRTAWPRQLSVGTCPHATTYGANAGKTRRFLTERLARTGIGHPFLEMFAGLFFARVNGQPKPCGVHRDPTAWLGMTSTKGGIGTRQPLAAREMPFRRRRRRRGLAARGAK